MADTADPDTGGHEQYEEADTNIHEPRDDDSSVNSDPKDDNAAHMNGGVGNTSGTVSEGDGDSADDDGGEGNLEDDLFGDDSDAGDGDGNVQDQQRDQQHGINGDDDDVGYGRQGYASNAGTNPIEDDEDDDEIFGRHDDDDDDNEFVGQADGAGLDDLQDEVPEPERPERILDTTLRHIDGPNPENPNAFLVRLPKFLSINPRPYDRNNYVEAVMPEDASSDAGSRERIRIQVENTIRWRLDPHDKSKSSNARLVRWSDNSFSLLLGEELFDVAVNQIAASREHHYLAIQHPEGFIQNRMRFVKAISFRPHSTQSMTHKKLTMAIAKRHMKTAKAKFLPTTVDPERIKIQIEKAELEKLKARRRLVNQRQAMEARNAGLGKPSRRGYDDEDGLGTGYRRGYGAGPSGDGYDDGDVDGDAGGAGSSYRRYESRDRDLLERIGSSRYDEYQDEDDSGFVVADDEVEEFEDDDEDDEDEEEDAGEYQREKERERRLQEAKRGADRNDVADGASAAAAAAADAAARKKLRMTIEDSDDD